VHRAPAGRARHGAKRPFELAALDVSAREVLRRLQREADARPKDWAKFTRQAVEFHLKTAESWGNRSVGVDLSQQIDPDFVMGPSALAAL
jgi:CO dehydrogenase maturation factor